MAVTAAELAWSQGRLCFNGGSRGPLGYLERAPADAEGAVPVGGTGVAVSTDLLSGPWPGVGGWSHLPCLKACLGWTPTSMAHGGRGQVPRHVDPS